MRVRVTQKDIDNGICMSHSFCPVALAIKRKTAHGVVVTGKVATICSTTWFEPRNWRHYSLPPVAREFIERFDFGFNIISDVPGMGPFEFVMKRVK